MRPTRTKTIVGGLLALVVVIVVAAAFLWPRPVEEPEFELTADREAPLPYSEAWSATDAEDLIHLDLETGLPTWRSSSDQMIFEGPAIEQIAWEWTPSTVGGWNLLSGTGEREGVQIATHIWTAPTFPAAIIDMDAIVEGPALSTPLDVLTTIPAGSSQLLTAFLTEQSAEDGEEWPIIGARFSEVDPTLQVHSPDGATGTVRKRDSDQSTQIFWNLWPALDELTPCLIEEGARRRVSLRLILTFGDHPAAVAPPVPYRARGMGTPIFTDPPRRTDDAWADGRSRDALEFSRRLRALAFGHSDSEDPRYGNGGLLAAGLGASFAIPAHWWDAEPIVELRASLSNTEIELLPAGHPDQIDEITAGTLLGSEFHCSSVAQQSAHQPETLIITGNEERAFEIPVASPLPQLMEVGQASTDREHLLNRLFEINRPDSLFSSGNHRVLLFPVVATRNPLEDIAAEEILSPDRGGHWTLHDSLTRRFSMWEFTPESADFSAISLQRLREHRWQQSASLPFFEPDGTLRIYPPNAADHHLLFMGSPDQLRDAPLQRNRDFPSWHIDLDRPTVEGPVVPGGVQLD